MSSAIWVWLDLEMTGLDPDEDQILEVSCVLTTPDLIQIGSESFSEVAHYSDDVLNNMSEWCIEHHGLSGLTKDVQLSSKSLAEIEMDLVAFLDQYVMEGDLCYLAGNSIHMDRLFIKKHMQIFERMLHYQMIDVTSIAIFLATLGKERYQKDSSHRALDDIRDSINELKHLKEQL